MGLVLFVVCFVCKGKGVVKLKVKVILMGCKAVLKHCNLNNYVEARIGCGASLKRACDSTV